MRLSALAAVLAAAVALLAPAVAPAAVAPPAPTGAAPVGLVRATLVDRGRVEQIAEGGGPRLIPLRVWYPAQRPGTAPGDVFTDAERAALEAEMGLPDQTFTGLGDTSTQHAPPARSRRVPLLSHGFGLTTALHTAQATDLASHGYVVIGIDHPGDAIVVDVGGGRLKRLSPLGGAIRERSFAERIADERFVLDRLDAVAGGRGAIRWRVGAFGHSLGGATAAAAMLADARIRAGVDVDGAIFGPVVEAGLDRPFGVLIGDLPLSAYEGLAAFRARLRGPRPFVRHGTTGHQGFTDIVWMVAQLGADPAAWGVGTVDAATAVAQQRRFLRRFFARHLPPR